MTYFDYITEYNKHTLLTRKEVANILLVKESTLDLWDSENRFNLPVVFQKKLAKHRYGDLLDFIERQEM